VGGVYSFDHFGVDGRPFELHVFVDHSVIEVFINDEKCISARAYPVGANATVTRPVITDTSKGLVSIEAWEMKSRGFSRE
jgi:beta-fructofuranosidase